MFEKMQKIDKKFFRRLSNRFSSAVLDLKILKLRKSTQIKKAFK